MESGTFYIFITLCFTVFMAAVLYLGTNVTKEQVDEIKSKGQTEFTRSQNLAITAAQFALYSAVIVSCFIVGEGLAKWLLN